MKRLRLRLGAEHDLALRRRLVKTLREANARSLGNDAGAPGSHEGATARYLVDNDELRVEANTFEGLMLEGAEALVRRIEAAVLA